MIFLKKRGGDERLRGFSQKEKEKEKKQQAKKFREGG